MNALCDRELKRTYSRYNARWFNGELPDDVDILFAPADCYGLVRNEDGGFLLLIDPKYAMDGRMWRMTLLHEMAHLKVWPYKKHGETFQRTMQRLAQLGAFAKLW